MKKHMSAHKLAAFLLSLSLIILCIGCSSGGKRVPESIIFQDLGIIADKADKVTYRHHFDSSTKIDTVTVTVTYDNKYCKSVCTSTYKYQYHNSDSLWYRTSKSSWTFDSHLKDFATKEGYTRIENFTTWDGKHANANSDTVVYYCLDISKGSINSEKNTLECRYDYEQMRDNSREFAFSSDGVETVTAKIVGGGAVFIDLKDPVSNRSQRIWLNGDDFIEMY